MNNNKMNLFYVFAGPIALRILLCYIIIKQEASTFLACRKSDIQALFDAKFTRNQ